MHLALAILAFASALPALASAQATASTGGPDMSGPDMGGMGMGGMDMPAGMDARTMDGAMGGMAGNLGGYPMMRDAPPGCTTPRLWTASRAA